MFNKNSPGLMLIHIWIKVTVWIKRSVLNTVIGCIFRTHGFGKPWPILIPRDVQGSLSSV